MTQKKSGIDATPVFESKNNNGGEQSGLDATFFSDPNNITHLVSLLVLLISGAILLISNNGDRDFALGAILIFTGLLLGVISLYNHSPKPEPSEAASITKDPSTKIILTTLDKGTPRKTNETVNIDDAIEENTGPQALFANASFSYVDWKQQTILKNGEAVSRSPSTSISSNPGGSTVPVEAAITPMHARAIDQALPPTLTPLSFNYSRELISLSPPNPDTTLTHVNLNYSASVPKKRFIGFQRNSTFDSELSNVVITPSARPPRMADVHAQSDFLLSPAHAQRFFDRQHSLSQSFGEHHSTPLIRRQNSLSNSRLCVEDNRHDDHSMRESLKLHFRRSMSSKKILTPTVRDKIRKSLLQTELHEGTPLKDVRQITVKEIKHRDAINYWREFPKIKFYQSKTVTSIIQQILNTLVPEIGVTYQHIIDQFLHSEWPISIFLHGGLLRDIMTSTIGNDVDITFTCGHREMKDICDKQGWKSEIREDIPYWVIGGASSFETKLEGFPLSFNGLAKPHVQDFFANTIYYDCKNNIMIDRYGMGVDAALQHRITLPCYSPSEWESWRTADFVPGVKMYRFYKFVTRDFDYDVDEARFVQFSIEEYVRETPEAAAQSCYHALVKLARGQDNKNAALEYKEKLKNKVIEINMHTTQEGYGNALEFWNSIWEPIVGMAILMGNFEDEASEPEPNSEGDGDISVTNSKRFVIE